VIELERTVEVERPPAEVFAHLQRAEGYGSWLPGIRSVVVEGDGPLVAGASLRLEFAGPTGPLIAAGTVTESTPTERLAIHAESRELRFDARIDLAPTGSGGATVTLGLRLELRGMFRFAERMVASRAPAELAEALERLRTEVETTPA
jgi:carbon monoxide dehydrogenase subunit G